MSIAEVELTPKVLFGRGARERLLPLTAGSRRVVVITTRGMDGTTQLVDLLEGLGDRVAAVFPRTAPHSPAETVEAATALASEAGADALLAVGGGAAIDTAKLVGARLDGLPALDELTSLNAEPAALGRFLTAGIPLLAAPTTISGAAFSADGSYSLAGRKWIVRHESMRPEAVVLDAELSALDGRRFASGAFTALSHCVASLRAAQAHPLALALASRGIDTLLDGVAALNRNGGDLDARQGLLGGEWLAALSGRGLQFGLLHVTCHVLGALSMTPHSALHSTVLPHLLEWDAASAHDEAERWSLTTGGDRDSFLARYVALRDALDLPSRLRELPVEETDLARAAQLIASHPAVRSGAEGSTTTAQVRTLLDRAW